MKVRCSKGNDRMPRIEDGKIKMLYINHIQYVYALMPRPDLDKIVGHILNGPLREQLMRS